jgi:hypothetical protein
MLKIRSGADMRNTGRLLDEIMVSLIENWMLKNRVLQGALERREP